MPGTWDVEYTDELGDWWADLTEAEQESIDSSVRLLEEKGPNLGFRIETLRDEGQIDG